MQVTSTLADPRGVPLACTPSPPTGSNSFIFAYIFAEKCPHRRLVSPQWLSVPPQTGNPGSATGQCTKELSIDCVSSAEANISHSTTPFAFVALGDLKFANLQLMEVRPTVSLYLTSTIPYLNRELRILG